MRFLGRSVLWGLLHAVAVGLLVVVAALQTTEHGESVGVGPAADSLLGVALEPGASVWRWGRTAVRTAVGSAIAVQWVLVASNSILWGVAIEGLRIAARRALRIGSSR